MADPAFLDDNGNPIYLDDNGEVIGAIDPSKLKVGSSTKLAGPSKGKFVQKGLTTQWQPETPVDINQRPDASMFSISEEAKSNYRDKIAGTLGEGAFSTWLGELPITALEMFSSPESLAVPSAVNRLAGINLPRRAATKIPQKALPAGATRVGPIAEQELG